MEAVNYLLIEVGGDYINKRDGLIVNTTIESVTDINRIGKVLSAPSNTAVQKGDEVIIHHNILRKRRNTKGVIMDSEFHVMGNTYFVPLTEAFMHKDNSGKWKPLESFCFVKPIEYDSDKGQDEITNSLSNITHKGKIKGTGLLTFPNKELLDQGLKEGDRILFSDYSEYEFRIDGEIYYKMSTKDIIGRIIE